MALRVAMPIVFLMALLVTDVLWEHKPIEYTFFILLLGLIASIIFIFFMIFESLKEKILDDISLTFNRKYFLEFLQKLPKKSKRYLVLVTIDNIKEINERYGIENGDKILRKFAFLLDQYFSKKYKKVPIGRIKSGDFLFVIENGDKNEIKKDIDTFLSLYDNSFIDNIEIKLFAAFLPFDKKEDSKTLINYLYEDIYFCKGKCKREDLRTKIAKKRRIATDQFEKKLLTLLEKGNISIRYQPAFNVAKRRFDMVEVIVKMFDEDGTLIHPSRFIPAINRLGYENRFDLLLTEALLSDIKEKELPTSILYSVNLSPYSIRNRQFTHSFSEIFKKYSLGKEHFVIELYENSVYKDIAFYEKILESYKREGFLLAFDHFGGYNASIEYIKEIPVDFIHFDRFITKKIENRRIGILVQTWIEALKRLHIKTVAKFIDDEKTAKIFEDLGVDYIQGYAISKPMDSENLKQFLGERDEIR